MCVVRFSGLMAVVAASVLTLSGVGRAAEPDFAKIEANLVSGNAPQGDASAHSEPTQASPGAQADSIPDKDGDLTNAEKMLDGGNAESNGQEDGNGGESLGWWRCWYSYSYSYYWYTPTYYTYYVPVYYTPVTYYYWTPVVCWGDKQDGSTDKPDSTDATTASAAESEVLK